MICWGRSGNRWKVNQHVMVWNKDPRLVLRACEDRVRLGWWLVQRIVNAVSCVSDAHTAISGQESSGPWGRLQHQRTHQMLTRNPLDDATREEWARKLFAQSISGRAPEGPTCKCLPVSAAGQAKQQGCRPIAFSFSDSHEYIYGEILIQEARLCCSISSLRSRLSTKITRSLAANRSNGLYRGTYIRDTFVSCVV